MLNLWRWIKLYILIVSAAGFLIVTIYYIFTRDLVFPTSTIALDFILALTLTIDFLLEKD